MRFDRYNILVGISAIVVGIIFLFDNFNVMPEVFRMSKLWPVFVIIGGLFVLFAMNDKNENESGDGGNS